MYKFLADLWITDTDSLDEAASRITRLLGFGTFSEDHSGRFEGEETLTSRCLGTAAFLVSAKGDKPHGLYLEIETQTKRAFRRTAKTQLVDITRWLAQACASNTIVPYLDQPRQFRNNPQHPEPNADSSLVIPRSSMSDLAAFESELDLPPFVQQPDRSFQCTALGINMTVSATGDDLMLKLTSTTKDIPWTGYLHWLIALQGSPHHDKT